MLLQSARSYLKYKCHYMKTLKEGLPFTFIRDEMDCRGNECMVVANIGDCVNISRQFDGEIGVSHYATFFNACRVSPVDINK